MSLKKKVGEFSHRIINTIISVRLFRRTSIIKIFKARGLEIAYLTVFFLFSAGIINGLIEGANPTMQNYLIFPQRGIQTLPETFVYIIVMATGSGGIYLLYNGGSQTVRQRISDFYTIFGFSSILLAVALSLYIFNIKL